MPLKRTPTKSPMSTPRPAAPPVPPPTATPAAPVPVPVVSEQQEDSAAAPNVTTRKTKRKQVNENGELSIFMAEVRQMFKDFKGHLEQKVEKMCSAVEDMRTTVDFLAEKYEMLRTQYDSLEMEQKGHVKYIGELEHKLEYIENNTRSTCLEIRNIPLLPTESKSSLLDTVVQLGNIINAPLQAQQVKDIFRIKTKDPINRPIIIDFTSVLQKEKTLFMYRKFNKQSSKLTTEHIKINGPAKPIYIAENLSTKKKRLFYLAREYAKENEFKFCWVKNGQIFLRKTENGTLIKITNEADFDNIIVKK